jgi:hypothetical protein
MYVHASQEAIRFVLDEEEDTQDQLQLPVESELISQAKSLHTLISL